MVFEAVGLETLPRGGIRLIEIGCEFGRFVRHLVIETDQDFIEKVGRYLSYNLPFFRAGDCLARCLEVLEAEVYAAHKRDDGAGENSP